MPTSSKGRLALGALREFAARGYAPVSVAEIAAVAGVTTGSLYHHFGGKPELYGFVRDEVERRVLDRMEGALAARADDGRAAAVRAALLVGFDYVAREDFARLLGEPRPGGDEDPIEALLERALDANGAPLGRLLAAAWRAALLAVIDGLPVAETRDALEALSFGGPT